MVLLGESVDERKLYAMFAADEAAHLDGIGRFYHTRDDAAPSSPFLALLSALIDDGDRQSLQAIIQVVLEGWGLTHYRALRHDCASPALRTLLGNILADEAAHHGSGVLLVGDRPLSPAASERIVETMMRFLALVQAGPLTVYAAVSTAVAGGPLDAVARRRLWAELEPDRSSAARLAQLNQLMHKSAALAAVTGRLERAGAFEPRCREPA
jgi:hypothetical protein